MRTIQAIVLPMLDRFDNSTSGAASLRNALQSRLSGSGIENPFLDGGNATLVSTQPALNVTGGAVVIVSTSSGGVLAEYDNESYTVDGTSIEDNPTYRGVVVVEIIATKGDPDVDGIVARLYGYDERGYPFTSKHNVITIGAEGAR